MKNKKLLIITSLILIAVFSVSYLRTDLFQANMDKEKKEKISRTADKKTSEEDQDDDIPWWCMSFEEYEKLYGGEEEETEEEEEEENNSGEPIPNDAAGNKNPPSRDSGSNSDSEKPEETINALKAFIGKL